MPPGSSIILNGSSAANKGYPGLRGVLRAPRRRFGPLPAPWSQDLKGRNIRVNVIAPGTVVTPAYKSELGMTDEQIEGFVAQASALTPLGRAGRPEEIAAAVLFLASDESSFVTATEFIVDGGATQV